MPVKKGKILVVYFYDSTLSDLISERNWLYCFEKYSGKLCFYVNILFKIPSKILRTKFDLIIFNHNVLGRRIARRFNRIKKNVEALQVIQTKRVAIPQDEFFKTNFLNEFINTYKINIVFSILSNQKEWENVYHGVDRSKVMFYQVLPYYVEPEEIKKINSMYSDKMERTTDIGYRVQEQPFSRGRQGQLKMNIAREFTKKASEHKLTTDISTKSKKRFIGYDWYTFLLKCKYTIGTEGGSSILDKDGTILLCVEKYLSKNPKASFEEVEKHCFKGIDGEFDHHNITPRNFEACATKTCQVLIEGEYRGILKPGIHFIELKKDFSNIDKVMEIIKSDTERKKIVERAYKDIIIEGKWYYEDFVQSVIKQCFSKDYNWSTISANDLKVYMRNKIRESMIRKYITIRSFGVKLVLSMIPKKIIKYLQRDYEDIPKRGE